MALGKIKADTLEHSTAGALDTQYVVNGSSKAWINPNTAKTAINDSLNISSLDDDGTGDFGLNYTTSCNTVYYIFSCGIDDAGTSTAVWQVDGTNGTYATGSTDFESYYVTSGNNRTNYDSYCHVKLLGDLA